MTKRISRDFEVFVAGATTAVPFKGKARFEIDGMGTRIYNHDGSVAFSGPTTVTVMETNSTEEDVPDASAAE